MGKTLWLHAVGRSMFPILRSGDALQVLRCEVSALAKGDIAVARRSDGALIAHLVRATKPFSTTTFLGRGDDDAGGFLGKAIAVRRGARKLALPRGARVLLWLLHLGAAAAYRSPRARAVGRQLRDAVSSKRTLPLRRRALGRLEVRLLLPGDYRAALLFAGDHLSLAPSFLHRQLPTRWQHPGAAAGAFDRRGRLVGFAFLDEYRQERVDLDGFWFRYVHCVPMARNMKVAQRLVAALCDAARARHIPRVLADVRAGNAASLAAFHGQGFTLAPAETKLVNAMRGSSQTPPEWVVLARTLLPR
jgi:mycothiol synthase